MKSLNIRSHAFVSDASHLIVNIHISSDDCIRCNPSVRLGPRRLVEQREFGPLAIVPRVFDVL